MPPEAATPADEMPRDALDALFVETVFLDECGAEARRRARPLRKLLAPLGTGGQRINRATVR